MRPLLGVALALSAATVSNAQPRPAGRGRSDGPRPLLFGFALECTQCESTAPRGGAGGGRGPSAVWHYSEYPRVVAVSRGGAAERAGVHEGDVLLSVDGLSVLTEDGARRFSGVRPGDEIRLTLERAAKTISVSLTLDRMFGRGGALAPAFERPDYSGRVGSVSVDVWSSASVVVSTDSTGATILRVGDTVVRLRSDGSPPPKIRGPAAPKP